MSRWLVRLAMVAWVGLGVASVAFVPEEEPLGPELASDFFGEARSIESSAPGGVLGLARALERLGFEVQAHTRVGPPEADVLWLLAPPGFLSDLETDALLDWVRQGGRLVYASRDLTVRVKNVDTSDAATRETEFELDDPFVLALAEAARARWRPGGEAELLVVGQGVVALLPESGEVLSNATLQAQGLSAELPWLEVILRDVRHLAFDEARLGYAASEGLIDLLMRSPFGVGVRLLLLALLVWLVATGVRRVPALPEPAAGGRAFGEHLDAVASVLEDSRRLSLAHAALVSGTRRRLGPLAATPAARAVLDDCAVLPRDSRRLLEQARALRGVEMEQRNVDRHASDVAQ